MNISTKPRHQPKHIQPVPEYDQDDEGVTEILADHTNQTKSILKIKGSTPIITLSPTKYQIPNTIRPVTSDHQQRKSHPTFTQSKTKPAGPRLKPWTRPTCKGPRKQPSPNRQQGDSKNLCFCNPSPPKRR